MFHYMQLYYSHTLVVADVVSVVEDKGHDDSGSDGRYRVDGAMHCVGIEATRMVPQDMHSNQHRTHCRIKLMGIQPKDYNYNLESANCTLCVKGMSPYRYKVLNIASCHISISY